MKALFIGGTGTISMAITRMLAGNPDWEFYLLNRGNRIEQIPQGVHVIQSDIQDEASVAEKLSGMQFDVVADFIAFVPEHIERDIRLFAGKTKQYIFISSASAYQKPLSDFRITESTPLCNPYWQYSRDKIACEERLMREYRENGFPVTIVRPSHTYGDTSVPVALHGAGGSWQVIRRMMEGKPVIIPGDGSSLWTLTHNTDFAKGFVGLMGNAHALGEAVQITSDESLTWNQIHQIIGGALGIEPKLIHIATDFLVACDPQMEGGLLGDKSNTVFFDNRKLKRLVPGFQATVRFDQGVRRTLCYIQGHPEYQTQDPAFDHWCDAVLEAYDEGQKYFQEYLR
ncbi:MAG: SDR family oxidoreductase [Clostridium sp.]